MKIPVLIGAALASAALLVGCGEPGPDVQANPDSNGVRVIVVQLDGKKLNCVGWTRHYSNASIVCDFDGWRHQ